MKNITQIRGRGAGLSKSIMAIANAQAATKVIDATALAYEELNKQCGINP